MEIREGNEYIAKYMGLPCQHKDPDKKWPLYESPTHGTYVEAEHLDYDSDYSAIMPVVEAITNEGHFLKIDPLETGCTLTYFGDEGIIEGTFEYWNRPLLETLSQLCYEFCKWKTTRG